MERQPPWQRTAPKVAEAGGSSTNHVSNVGTDVEATHVAQDDMYPPSSETSTGLENSLGQALGDERRGLLLGCDGRHLLPELLVRGAHERADSGLAWALACSPSRRVWVRPTA